MFWRRKNDGFEWHKYVRTTIKLRRDDRRRRVREAKDAAIDGLENAGRAGLQAGKAGAISLGAGMSAAAIATWYGLSNGFGRALVGLREVMALAGRGLARAASLSYRAVCEGAGTAWTAAQLRLPVLARVPQRVATAVAVALAGFFALGIGAIGARYLPSTGVNPLALIPGFGTKVVEGRATAVNGDTLRVNGQLVKLTGIEAPEVEQRCGANQRIAWRCGVAAQSGLRDLVRNKPVRCEAGAADASGRLQATCTVADRDLAAELAGKGLVFAEEGVFSRYASREREAREAKRGVWRTSSPERPKAYRDRRWEVARKAAPEGCPIKGHIVSGDRVYVLPWSAQYERVRVRERSGGRWFCSEAEARAAGWRAVVERS